MNPQIFDQLIVNLLELKKKSIKHKAKPKLAHCEDCDQMVLGRTVVIYRSGIGTDHEHWRKNCQICSKKIPLDIKIINRNV